MYRTNAEDITQIVYAMKSLEKLADDLRNQSYSKLGATHELQSDYKKAVRDTLAAYSRLAERIELIHVIDGEGLAPL
jgi:hypothetical protein